MKIGHKCSLGPSDISDSSVLRKGDLKSQQILFFFLHYNGQSKKSILEKIAFYVVSVAYLLVMSFNNFLNFPPCFAAPSQLFHTVHS